MGDRGTRLSLGIALMFMLSSFTSAKYVFVDEPLARTSPALGEEDLFGYATALHRVDNSGADNDFNAAITSARIIVGAPSGTYPGGLSLTGIDGSNAVNNAGLVYQCPILPGLCGPVSGNGADNDIRLFDYEGNEIGPQLFDPNLVPYERKEGQFMGATIISSGEHLMACAPRWVSIAVSGSSDFDLSRGHGRCFISGRNMENFTLLRPCDSGGATLEGGEAYCMSGTSAAIDEQEEATDIFSVYLGSPPRISSHGAVHEYSDVADNFTNDPTTTLVYTQETGFLYGGLAVALGRITNKDDLNLISALPKNTNYTGSVSVFEVTDPTMAPVAEVFGKQMGEYFGWSLATADLNGDGYDEVIVGAPLFSTVDGIEKGRVFIFKNNMGDVTSEEPIIITGSEMKGRFGSAIVNLGDINSDGFEDIAISAPFVDDGSGAEGSVYIYLGSGDDFIQQTAEQVQVITALQISQTLGLDTSNYLQSFGYSLSSGLDVDANFNNDLVIGGYKTQTVVVLRTYSIANVSLSLTTLPDELLDYTNRNCTFGLEMFACFDLEITASFSGRGLDERSLDTMVSVRENAVSSGQRIFFEDSAGTDNFESFLNFTTTNDSITRPIRIYVENGIADRRTPLSVLVNVFSIERKQRSVDGSQDIIDLRDIPLLNILPQNDLEAQLSLAGCEIPDQCRPNLTLTLNTTIYNDVEIEGDVIDIIVGQQPLDGGGVVPYIELVLDYQTLSDDAIDSSLVLYLPQNVFGKPTSSVGGDCISEGGGNHRCLLEPIFSNYEGLFQVTIRIPLSNSLVGNEEDVLVTVKIENMDNSDPVSFNNYVNITTTITARNEITIPELVVSPNMTQYGNDEEDFGREVTARINFFGSGPTTIPSSRVTFYIPDDVDMTGDSYYLYPARMQPETSVSCTGINPDNAASFNEAQRRRRRSRQSSPVSDMERLSRMMSGGDNNKMEGVMVHKRAVTQAVNCAVQRDLCAVVECDIYNITMDPITISLTLAVDNRFFRSRSGDFEFFVYATYSTVADYFPTDEQDITSNKFVVQKIDQTSDDTIPIWVYVVSVLLGLIILVLIIIAIFVLVILLRRRTKKKIKKIRRDTERRRSLNRAASASTGVAVTSIDTKPVEGADGDGIDDKPKPPQPDDPDAGEDPDETEL